MAQLAGRSSQARTSLPGLRRAYHETKVLTSGGSTNGAGKAWPSQPVGDFPWACFRKATLALPKPSKDVKRRLEKLDKVGKIFSRPEEATGQECTTLFHRLQLVLTPSRLICLQLLFIVPTLVAVDQTCERSWLATY